MSTLRMLSKSRFMFVLMIMLLARHVSVVASEPDRAHLARVWRRRWRRLQRCCDAANGAIISVASGGAGGLAAGMAVGPVVVLPRCWPCCWRGRLALP